MIAKAALAMTVAMSGCAGWQSRDYAATAAVGGIAADAVTTHVALDRGCFESNPLLMGLRRDEILLVNGAVAAAVYYFKDEIPEPLLWMAGAARWGIAAKNANEDC